MFDHYRINVALNRRHLFATDPGSCRDAAQAEAVYRALKLRFPENEGFNITVTRWKARGEHVEFPE